MTRAFTVGGRWALEARLGVLAGLVAVVWSLVVLDPFGPATIDPDASSSVLYFDRIASLRQLEAFVPTTPKPLLTLVYGVTWSLIHDWRALVWETILVWGVAVGATAAFVGRVAGRIAVSAASVAAGTFATAALLTSSDLMLEVSRANSLLWALAGWSVAGLAVTAQPVRPRLAGLALLLAGLCRFETLALTAVAVVAATIWLRARRPATPLVPGIIETAQHFEARQRSVAAKRSQGVLVGVALALAAIPTALAHDWLLTGDPFYWLKVPSRYTAIFNPGLQPIGPFEYAGTFLGRVAPGWPLLLLAVVGVVVLVRAREWPTLAAITAIGLGVAALLFLLAARATYISNRYYEPIDLALIVSAAIGVGWLAAVLLRRMRVAQPFAAPAMAAAAAVAAIVGLAVMWPALPWDRRASTELTDVRNSSALIANVLPLLGPLPHWDEAGAWGAQRPPDIDPALTYLLVPSRHVARVIVENDSSLVYVGNLYEFVLRHTVDALHVGQRVVHDSAANRPAALFKPFEIDAAPQPPPQLGGHAVVGVRRLGLPGTNAQAWLLTF